MKRLSAEQNVLPQDAEANRRKNEDRERSAQEPEPIAFSPLILCHLRDDDFRAQAFAQDMQIKRRHPLTRNMRPAEDHDRRIQEDAGGNDAMDEVFGNSIEPVHGCGLLWREVVGNDSLQNIRIRGALQSIGCIRKITTE